MNILSISTLLPIPEVFTTNDFVFQTYLNYKKQYKEDYIHILKPVKLSFNLIQLLKGDTRLQKLKQRYQWQLNGFDVEIFPFLSSWRLRNLHSILCRSIFYLNSNRIKDLISIHKFDVIHAQYIFSDGMLAYMIHKKYNIPYVITTHNEAYYFKHVLSRRMADRILKNAAQVIPINFSNADFFRSSGHNNIKLIPLGFNGDFIKKQRNSTSDTIQILTVSVLTKLKNIDKVLYAIKELVLTFKIRYTIVGKGPEKEYLMSLVDRLNLADHVIFREYIPHEAIAEEMYKHDIFIMPSFFETFGRVYFECMAMGIPIICAKNSGIFGIFQDREEGMAVDHTNINEITEVLEYLISQPEERKRIGLNGQKLVKKHTWEHVVEELHSVYNNSLISKN